MKSAGLRSTLVFLVLLVAFSASHSTASPESLQRLLSSTLPEQGVSVSLLFEPLVGDGQTIAFQQYYLQPPASVQKLVTTAAALDMLGPDHTFMTELMADKPIRHGRLNGHLYLHGDGDPFLVTERMWLLAHEARVAGLREVQGALVVDADRVADLDLIRGGEDAERTYAAPVSRLAMNFNSLTFLIRPAEIVGSPAVVWLEPFPIPRVSIDARVRTGVSGRGGGLKASRSRSGEIDIWTISGTVAVDSPPRRIYRAAREPALLAGGILAGLLGQQGIEIDAIRHGKAPKYGLVIASLESLPLRSLVRSMNSHSNNFMADLLLVSLGEQGNGGSGCTRVEEWLDERVPVAPKPTVVDGSGLSVRNRTSAEQIVRLLKWAHGQEKVFPDLYASLPRPGGIGTLEKRFDDVEPPALRAKTGTLGDHGVSGMAGYIDHPTKGRYAFCILQQASAGSKVPIAQLRLREEDWLCEFVTP